MMRSLLVLGCMSSALWADVGIKVDRDRSSLTIELTSDKPVKWRLENERFSCREGQVNAGATELLFPKLGQEALTFRIEGDALMTPKTVSIEANPSYSELAKVEDAAVIYQLPVRSYFAASKKSGEAGKLEDLTDDFLEQLESMSVDYLWLTGVIEHAALSQTDPDVVKGNAGSFYAIYDSWDVSNQVGDLADLVALIDRAHDRGIRILLDFVANHTARNHRTDVVCKEPMDFGVQDDVSRPFYRKNHYYYMPNQTFQPPYQEGAEKADGIYDRDIFATGIQFEVPAKVTGNDILSAKPKLGDWFETVKLNYGYDVFRRQPRYDPQPATWAQMVDVARFWLEKGVDGFRVDFAHAVPMEFWRYFTKQVRALQPEVFLLAEAYENDERMKLPGFSYEALFAAGFDSVYNSQSYWRLRTLGYGGGDVHQANLRYSPAMRPAALKAGYLFTSYLENHDELRLASRPFAPALPDINDRRRLGLAVSTYAALWPGHLLIHGGQEVGEDASVTGKFAGANGRTSIFDFVFQRYTKMWWQGEWPEWMTWLRTRYLNLSLLKHKKPFAVRHQTAKPSYLDLEPINYAKGKWLGSYIRYDQDQVYLVVTNADPLQSHEVVIHFTDKNAVDSHGALEKMGVKSGSTRYRFTEVHWNPGWEPKDPNVQGEGLPGTALFQSGGIPSGLYLGEVPKATTYVFKVEEM